MNDDLTNANQRLDDGSFLPVIPDGNPDFNPERNKRIIQSVMKNNIENRKKKLREWEDKMGERADAVSYFITSEKFRNLSPRAHIDGELKGYFGKHYLDQLTDQASKHEDPLVVLDKNGYIVRDQNFDGTKTGERKKKKI